MTSLNEDDFLEKLMSYLHRRSEGGGDRCPDSESLVAFAEGTLDARRSGDIRDHFARCAACAEIHERLLRFESNFQPSQWEWRNTAKRLDNWMDSFTAKRTRVKENRKAGPWQRFWPPKALSPVSYGLATAAIALVVGVSLNLSYRFLNAPNIATVMPAQEALVSPSVALPQIAKDLDVIQKNQLETVQHTVVLKAVEPTSTLLSDVKASYAPAVGSLPNVRVEAGTELLLRLVSTKQLNGSFSFQGLLLKPLRQKSKELFPAGSLVAGRGVPSLKELTIEILQLPIGVRFGALDARSAPTRYFLHGSRANVTISGDASRNFSAGKTVEVRFVLRSNYQIQPSP